MSLGSGNNQIHLLLFGVIDDHLRNIAVQQFHFDIDRTVLAIHFGFLDHFPFLVRDFGKHFLNDLCLADLAAAFPSIHRGEENRFRNIDYDNGSPGKLTQFDCPVQSVFAVGRTIKCHQDFFGSCHFNTPPKQNDCLNYPSTQQYINFVSLSTYRLPGVPFSPVMRQTAATLDSISLLKAFIESFLSFCGHFLTSFGFSRQDRQLRSFQSEKNNTVQKSGRRQERKSPRAGQS